MRRRVSISKDRETGRQGDRETDTEIQPERTSTPLCSDRTAQSVTPTATIASFVLLSCSQTLLPSSSFGFRDRDKSRPPLYTSVDDDELS